MVARKPTFAICINIHIALLAIHPLNAMHRSAPRSCGGCDLSVRCGVVLRVLDIHPMNGDGSK
jgi:hypothetical protein